MKNICMITLLLSANLYSMDRIIKKHTPQYQDNSIELNSLSSDSFYDVENLTTIKELERRQRSDGLYPVKRFKRILTRTLFDIQLFLNKNKYKIQ